MLCCVAAVPHPAGEDEARGTALPRLHPHVLRAGRQRPLLLHGPWILHLRHPDMGESAASFLVGGLFYAYPTTPPLHTHTAIFFGKLMKI